MSNYIRITLAVCMLALTGCATGVAFSEMQPSTEAIDEQHSRIFFYRATNLGFGSGVQPKVLLNDEVVGGSQIRWFFLR
jgi:hypothetical protein